MAGGAQATTVRQGLHLRHSCPPERSKGARVRLNGYRCSLYEWNPYYRYYEALGFVKTLPYAFPGWQQHGVPEWVQLYYERLDTNHYRNTLALAWNECFYRYETKNLQGDLFNRVLGSLSQEHGLLRIHRYF